MCRADNNIVGVDLDSLCAALSLLDTGCTIFRAIYRDGKVDDAMVVFVNPAGKYGEYVDLNVEGMLFQDIFLESVELGIWDHYRYVLETRQPWKGRIHYNNLIASDYFDLELVPLADDMVMGFHRICNEEIRALETALEMSRTLMDTIGMVFDSTRPNVD